MKKKISDTIREKAIGIIATLLTLFIVFIIVSFTEGINKCGKVETAQVEISKQISEKVDQVEFEYYKQNIEVKVDMIFVMLKEIRDELKDQRK